MALAEVASAHSEASYIAELLEETSAELCALVAVGNLAHALHTFWDAHLFVKYGAVSGQVHAANIVGRVRNVRNLYPGMPCSVFVNQAVLVVCHHFVQLDAGVHLGVHRQQSEEQEQA